MKNKRFIKTFGLIAGIMLFCAVVCFISTGMTFASTAENTAFSGGDGTESSPYLIGSADDCVQLMNGVNDRTAADGYFGKHFRLNANIDLTGIVMAPIGDFTYPFKGRLDGSGYSISGLNIDSENNAYVGLFGVISTDSVIENLTVSGTVTGLSDVGGIVGLNNGRIAGCESNVAVSSKADNTAMDIGGVCGCNKGIVENSYNTGKIIGYGVNTGGITGLNSADGSEAVIRNCYNVGVIESDFYGAGGIAGHNDGSIGACYNSVAVSAYSTAGGIAGSNAGTIENAYNTSNISVTNNMAGGIAGSCEGAIYNAYSRGEVSAASLKGGICGFVSAEAVVDACFFSSNTFAGKMTNRGNDYPNSAVLRDADMTTSDALTNAKKMKTLGEGRGADNWTKRAFDDDFCYLPELKVFGSSSNGTAVSYSKDSAKHERVVTDVSLGTLSYVYDGKAHEPDIYLGEEKLVKGIDYTVVYSDNVEAGTATAAITLINYYSGSVEKNFTVTKSPITVKWSEETFTYNGKTQYPTVTITEGRVGDEEITFTYTGAGTTAGKHTVTAALADTAVNANYSFTAESKEYAIKTAALTIKWSTEQIIYNGEAQYPTASVSGGVIGSDEVTLEYSGYENNINAGEGYTVTVVPADGGDNGNYSISETHTYGIAQRPISVIFKDEKFTYNGTAQYPKVATVTGAVAGEELTFVYSGYEGNIAAGNGYKVFAELALTAVNANYVMAKTECVYSISESALDIKFSDEKLTFNGKPQRPSFTVSGLLEGDEIKWVLSDYSANIDASTGGFYILTVSLGSGSDYKFEPVTISYDITPMPIKIAWEGDSLVYNGRLQRPEAEVVTVTPTVVGLKYSSFNGIDAGEGYSIAITADSANYVVTNTLTYDILPRTVTAEWSGMSFIYSGQIQMPTVKLNGTVEGETIEFEYIGEQGTRVGNYQISARIHDGNYILTANNFQYKILPKRIEIENVTAVEKRYDGTTEIKLSGGKIVGLESGDDVGFELNSGIAESANAGTWRVTVNVSLTGADADCYELTQPEIYATIRKSVLNLEGITFESETFAYDSGEKSLKIEGNLPDCVIVEYIGNGKTEVGEYTVTARFTDTSGNYEPIPDMTAMLTVSQSSFTDEEASVNVSIVDGVLPYGSEIKVEKKSEWSGEYGSKQALGAFDISLFHGGAEIQPNGKLKITLTLDEKLVNAKGLILLHVHNGISEEVQYTIEGSILTFYTDSLSEFVLLGDPPSNMLWYIAGAVALALFAVASAVVTVAKKRRASAIVTDIAVDNNAGAVDYASVKALAVCNADKAKRTNIYEDELSDLPEISFELDGIHCASKTSFLAALCFKNPIKQKEVAAMSADKARIHAVGKGGDKRSDLYWHGKSIIKGSPEYVKLLRRVTEQIKSKSDTI